MSGVSGISEVGLPPKKPHVYVADYRDVVHYFSEFLAYFAQSPNVPPNYSPLEGIMTSATIPADLYPVFYALDHCPCNAQSFSRPPRNGIECALLDLASKRAALPAAVFLLGRETATHTRPCFYTIGIADEAETESSALFGRRFTPFFKIKCNDDVAKTISTLDVLLRLVPAATLPPGTFWTLDANAAWSPEVSMRFLEALRPYEYIVKVIEQPFPVSFIQDLKAGRTMTEWVDVRKAYNAHGIRFFADESVAVHEDVALLRPFVDGVNVKLDKAGGLRETMRVLKLAREAGLAVWIGMMVGSVLASNVAAAVLPGADYGDLDGGLLVCEDSQLFQGGFHWTSIGHCALDLATPGFGVIPKA